MDGPGVAVEKGRKRMRSEERGLDLLRIRTLRGITTAHQLSISRRRFWGSTAPARSRRGINGEILASRPVGHRGARPGSGGASLRAPWLQSRGRRR